MFFLKNHSILELFYYSIPWIVRFLIALFVIAIIWVNIARKKFLFMGNREIFYLIAALVIGPGLIVNVICKDNVFGRARPSQVKEFGGDKIFAPILAISKQCTKNCSFASGHASIGFYLTAFSYIARKKYLAKLIFYFGLGFGTMVGMVRVAQGGHFLSDVIFAALIVIMVNHLLYFLFYRKRG